MRTLREFFHTSFGVPLKQIIPLPNEELFSLSNNDLLYGSATAKAKPYLLQGDINDFISSKDTGYFLIGFWGHGINSYAFYYSRIDEWSHIFFRLAFGGVYQDNAAAAIHVRQFLENYFAFEPQLKTMVKSLTAIESMDYGHCTMTLMDGRLVTLGESLYGKADFQSVFRQLIL